MFFYEKQNFSNSNSCFQTFLSQSQWSIAYNEEWGNRNSRYPNFFSSLNYVGDGINGLRLDLYYPIGMEINLNNIGV